MQLKNIHLVFKTHLDVGFTNYARVITRDYFETYIPRALDVAERIKAFDGMDFVWTTGSWLIYEYLHTQGAERVARMEQAIRDGVIAWHGLPFTTHTELMNREMFEYCLSLSRQLDERFGRHYSVAAKMTDVPGHTRALVPPMADAGVKFLHIGVNQASTAPEVPDVFRWRSEGREIIVMYHKTEYGEFMQIPGTDQAIMFCHTNDNLGPQSLEEVVDIYRTFRAKYPGVKISSATLADIVPILEGIRDTLPVVEAELGDTWIHGAGTDPYKVGCFRSLMNLRGSLAGDPGLDDFTRKLGMIPEHTWGMDEKTHLRDKENYTKKDFTAVRNQPNFQKFQSSWAEQRDYLTQAVDALQVPESRQKAKEAMAQLRPTRPDLSGFRLCGEQERSFEAGSFRLSFDDAGAVNALMAGDRVVADGEHRLGAYWYQTFSAGDYRRFFSQYDKPYDWAYEDFTKPGLADEMSPSARFAPVLRQLWVKESKEETVFVLQLAMDEEIVSHYGAPAVLYSVVTVPAGGNTVCFDLRWFEKQANRMPEASWFSFQPLVDQPENWKMEKMGVMISPLEVVSKGNRHLHGVERGVFYADGARKLSILTRDAALVAPGQTSLLNFVDDQPDLSGGMHFNLHNNLWGTNFPMWYEDDARFRFALKLD